MKSSSQLFSESFDSSFLDFCNSIDDKSVASSEMSSKAATPLSSTFSNSSIYNKESMNFLNSQTSKTSLSSSTDDSSSRNSTNNSISDSNSSNKDKKKLSFNNSSRSISINYDLLKIIENATLCANKSGYNVTVAIQDLDSPGYSYQSSINSFSDDDSYNNELYPIKNYKIEDKLTKSKSSSNINSQTNSTIPSKRSSLSLEYPLDFLYNNSSDSNIYFPMLEYNMYSLYKYQDTPLRRTKSEIFNINKNVQRKANSLSLRKQKSDSQLYDKSFMEYYNKTCRTQYYDQMSINSMNNKNNNRNSIGSVSSSYCLLLRNIDNDNKSINGSLLTDTNKKNNKKLHNMISTPHSSLNISNSNICNNTNKANNTPLSSSTQSNNLLHLKTDSNNNKINVNLKLLSKSNSQDLNAKIPPINSSNNNDSNKLKENSCSECPPSFVPIVTHYKEIFNPAVIKSSFNIFEDMHLENDSTLPPVPNSKNINKDNKVIKSSLMSFTPNSTSTNSNVCKSKHHKNATIVSLPEITVKDNTYERKIPLPPSKKAPTDTIHSLPDIYQYIPNDKIYKPQITIQYKGPTTEDDIDRYVTEDNQSYYCPPTKENIPKKISSKKMNKIEPQIYHKPHSSAQVSYDSKEMFHDTSTIMKKIESEYSINDYSEEEDNITFDYFYQVPDYNEMKPPPLKSFNFDSYHYISEHDLPNPFQKEYTLDDRQCSNSNYEDEYIFFYDEKDIPINKIKSFISTKSLKNEIGSEKNLDLSLRKRKSYREPNLPLFPQIQESKKTTKKIDQPKATTSVETIKKDSNDSNKKEKKNVCEFCHKKLRITATYKCKCNKIFCAAHRYSECHNCTYNYKQQGKKDLEKNNPLVVKDKISKI